MEEVVRLHAGNVYRVVAGYVGTAEAEDATQEVFVQVQQGLQRFQGRAQLGTWIFKIATNVGLKRLRRLKRKPPPRPLDGVDAVAPGAGPHADAEDRELKEAFRQALSELPEDQRAVVVLRGVNGLPYDEVSRVLGIPTPTAHSRMSRACVRLRSLLGRFVETEKTTSLREERS